MASRPLILLLDGNAIVHRAYHALPPLSSASGEPTNATFGFTTTLLKVLSDLKPKYAEAAFDVGRTFRHELYEAYKGTRPKTAEDLAPQLKRTQEVAAAFNIPVKYLGGYEADDVLATLAKKAAAEALDVIIVTGDTDTLQLVGPHVKVLLSGRKFTDTKLYDEAAVRERYGLEPSQLVDLKSLKGDLSDNIPGVPGVGDITATRLVKEYGSVESLYGNIEKVEPRLRENLKKHEEALRRAKGLIKLVDDLPIDLDLDQAIVGAYDRDRVLSLFRELQFLRLVDRLPKPPEEAAGQLHLFESPLGQAPHRETLAGDYRMVNTEAALDALMANIRAAGACALDVESTSQHPVEATLVGLSLSWHEGEGDYVPVGHSGPGATASQLSLDLVREKLAPILGDERIAKYAHNANYDLIVLDQHGIVVRGLAFDTMIAAHLLDPASHNLGLKDLVFQQLGVEMSPIESLLGKGKAQLTMDKVPVERVARYCAADADMTFRLKGAQERQLKEKRLWSVFSQIEMPLVPVLTDMECTGVLLDVGVLKNISGELSARLNQLQQQIQEMVGAPVNLNSPQQLSDALFVLLGLSTDGVPRGASGRFSTAAEVLENLRGSHPVMDLLLEHRQLSKIKSTYADTLPLLVNRRTTRLHTSWNQTGTVTGRLSSSEPNLQNIPIRSDLGRRVRQAFAAPAGRVLLAADYSQVELRILAHISGDENLLAAFQRGEDIHARTASAILNVALDKVTPDMRRIAKVVNFGLIYGMSDWGLASRTQLSREEASEFIAKYFGQFPRVRQYLESVKTLATEQGYVETLLGRKRYFPELRSTSKVPGNVKASAQRMAVNFPIQGSAADIIKIAMINLHMELHRRHLGSEVILQVHDELVLEVPEKETAPVSELVKSIMEGAYRLDAPLKVDIKTGRHWGEME